MAAVVGHDSPEITALGGLPARVQNWGAGLVHEDPVEGAQMGLHLVDHRHQVEAGAPRPVAERAAAEIQPLPLEDPRLAVERQVVAELGHDDPCDHSMRRTKVAQIYKKTGSRPRKQGSITTLRALANALGVSLDDLAE